jgi:hypothetical protein
MTPEEPSSNTPQSASSRPPISRADVAIGSLSRQLVRRNPLLQPDRPLPASDPAIDAPENTQPLPAEPLTPVFVPQTVVIQQSSQPNVAMPPVIQMPEPIVDQITPQPTVPNAVALDEQPTAKKSGWSLPSKRVAGPVLIAVIVIAFGSGLFSWINYQHSQNTPQKIFSDALQASLNTTQIASQTSSSGIHNSASYDFTNPTDPVVSTQQTATMDGSTFQLAGYGSATNTYVSYTKFPSLVSANISSLATNGWIQLRSNGRLPSGVASMLTDASDPRYQTIGLLTFGNFPSLTREQLIKYMLAENIYQYKPSEVTDTTIDGAKVMAYPVSLNLNFLQILDESVATDEGFSPSDVQDAISGLANWSGAKATFYVSTITHRFVAVTLVKNGVATTTDYTNYDNVTMPGEPETKLSWEDFAPVQNMINAQVAPRPAVLASKTVTKTTAATVKE